MTVNEVIGKVIARVKDLANQRMDDLRLQFPEETETGGQLVRICKDRKYDRGELIEAILMEEFVEEFDKEILT